MSKLKIKNGNTWEEIPVGGVGVPSGGTAGQILMKSSSTDYADEWADISEAGAMSAWELLWTNASPTSSFAAQTVAFDLSGYDAVLIVYKREASATITQKCTTLIPKGEDFLAYMMWKPSTTFLVWVRPASVLDTGVQFNSGKRYIPDGNTEANMDDVMIPLTIYGIKGVNS